jgi:hypothetical protein
MDFRDKEVRNMRKIRWLAMSAILAVAVSGCGKLAETGKPAAGGDAGAPAAGDVAQGGQTVDDPAAAVHEFLEALRTGNDEKASKMLSRVAREKTASLNRNVTPPASDSARFTVGKVDLINDDGARVACTWTDLDDEGKPATDQAVWVLRREQDGWRVAGLAAQAFPGEEPLLLNFEDPDDMLKKQQWIRAERRRRMEAGGLQAQGEKKEEKSIRR